MRRQIRIASGFVSVIAVLGVASVILDKRNTVEASTGQAPRFEVDPLWPKPLPNHWVMGMTIGVSVDAQDHIWIVHRSGSNDPGEQHDVAAKHPDIVARLKARYDQVIKEIQIEPPNTE